MRKRILSMMPMALICNLGCSADGLDPHNEAGLTEQPIVGGYDAFEGDFPSMASLTPANNIYDVFCGASLIHPRFVLTAAHCLRGKSPSDVRVVFDRYNITEDGVAVRPMRFHIHPEFDLNQADYDWVDYAHDIALIELERSPGVRPTLPIDRLEGDNYAEGQVVTVTGFGYTSNDFDYTDALQEASMDFLGRGPRCEQISSYPNLESSQLCIGDLSGDVDSCEGDSGGPAYVDIGGVWQQFGVVSVGEDCGRAGYPGVYVSVGDHRDWIEGILPNYWRTAEAATAGDEYAAWSNTTASSLKVGDFNGDGDSDVLASWGGKWHVSHSASTSWQTTASSSVKTRDMLIGNFVGSAADDVFASWGGYWYVSDGARTSWVRINKSSYEVSSLTAGDFNGDGRDDILANLGGYWNVSWSGASRWQRVAKSAYRPRDLLVGDFNGDGRDDVLAVVGGSWQVSYSAQSSWEPINTRYSVHPSRLAVGQFDANPGEDILFATGSEWRISYGGETSWFVQRYSEADFDDILIGNFDGSTGNAYDDVFQTR